MFKKRGKRGISPLIATVLLIAFAVSIGTMIMSWGKDVIGNPGDCESVNISLQTISQKPFLCYDTLNTKINFIIKNTGDIDVRYLKLRVTGLDYSLDELNIEDSAIKAGDVLNKNVNYVKSGTFKVELVPVIFTGGKEKSCTSQAVVAETIERCN